MFHMVLRVQHRVMCLPRPESSKNLGPITPMKSRTCPYRYLVVHCRVNLIKLEVSLKVNCNLSRVHKRSGNVMGSSSWELQFTVYIYVR